MPEKQIEVAWIMYMLCCVGEVHVRQWYSRVFYFFTSGNNSLDIGMSHFSRMIQVFPSTLLFIH